LFLILIVFVILSLSGVSGGLRAGRSTQIPAQIAYRAANALRPQNILHPQNQQKITKTGHSGLS